MKLTEIKAVVWVASPTHHPTAISYNDHRQIIVPSYTGAQERSGVGLTRFTQPQPGTIETSCFVRYGEANSIAWPTENTVVFDSPGYHLPMIIKWIEDQGKVFSQLVPIPGLNCYTRIYPGANERRYQHSPNPLLTTSWDENPVAGQTDLCWVSFYIGNRGPVGSAWKANMKQFGDLQDIILAPDRNFHAGVAWEEKGFVLAYLK